MATFRSEEQEIRLQDVVFVEDEERPIRTCAHVRAATETPPGRRTGTAAAATVRRRAPPVNLVAAPVGRHGQKVGVADQGLHVLHGRHGTTREAAQIPCRRSRRAGRASIGPSPRKLPSPRGLSVAESIMRGVRRGATRASAPVDRGARQSCETSALALSELSIIVSFRHPGPPNGTDAARTGRAGCPQRRRLILTCTRWLGGRCRIHCFCDMVPLMGVAHAVTVRCGGELKMVKPSGRPRDSRRDRIGRARRWQAWGETK